MKDKRRDLAIGLRLQGKSIKSMAAENYWQEITGIGRQQFYKTYNKPNRSSKCTRNSLPYGVCDLYVQRSASLLLQIKGWTNGIYESVIQ